MAGLAEPLGCVVNSCFFCFQYQLLVYMVRVNPEPDLKRWGCSLGRRDGLLSFYSLDCVSRCFPSLAPCASHSGGEGFGCWRACPHFKEAVGVTEAAVAPGPTPNCPLRCLHRTLQPAPPILPLCPLSQPLGVRLLLRSPRLPWAVKKSVGVFSYLPARGKILDAC